MTKGKASTGAAWLASLTPQERASIPSERLRQGDLLDPDRRQQTRAEQSRAREHGRKRDRRKPPGERARLRKLTAADVWAEHSLAEHSFERFWGTVRPEHRRMAQQLAELIERLSDPLLGGEIPLGPNGDAYRQRTQELGQQAQSGDLARLERAHAAAFADRPPSGAVWQWQLRHHVGYALAKRMNKWGPAYPGLTSGSAIVAHVRGMCPGTVPRGLTGARVERLLGESTLGAGGGPKRTKNFHTAVDELIRELGEEPWAPPKPPRGELDG